MPRAIIASPRHLAMPYIVISSHHCHCSDTSRHRCAQVVFCWGFHFSRVLGVSFFKVCLFLFVVIFFIWSVAEIEIEIAVL